MESRGPPPGRIGRAKGAVSRHRSLFLAFATTGGTAVLINLLGGVTGIVQSRALGPEQRGLLAAAVVWPGVIGLIVAFQSPAAATYFVAREPQRERRAEAGCTAIALGGTIGLVVSIVGIIGSLIIGGPAKWALVVMFAWFWPNIIAGIGLGALLGLEDYRGWSRIRLLMSALSLVGVIVIVSIGWRTAVAVSVVLFGSQIAQLAAVIVAMRRASLLARPRMVYLRPVFSYAWRNAANVGWLVTYQLDQLVLSIAVRPAQLGMYAVAASFGAVIVPIASSTGVVILARTPAGGHAEVRRSLPLALGLCALVAGGAGLVLEVGAPLIVRLLFGARYLGAVAPMRILLPGIVALALSSVLSSTLLGLGRPLIAARAEAVGAIATVVLLAALIPPLGIRGAALASTLSYAAVMGVMAAGLRSELLAEIAARRRRR